MSAFMMDPKTTAMLAEQIATLIEWDYVSCRLPAKTYINSKDKEAIIKVCHKWNAKQEVPNINPVNNKTLYHVMENMNALALNARYNDEISECLSPYPANANKPANMAALYKSLKCYLYQCTEGDVPESDLYKAIENISTTIAEYIISDLPEYELAAWG